MKYNFNKSKPILLSAVKRTKMFMMPKKISRGSKKKNCYGYKVRAIRMFIFESNNSVFGSLVKFLN